jgi:6-phosphogluconate dehydrogenase (decarboxylating)
MKSSMIGFGRMGANSVRRRVRAGRPVFYDPHSKAVQALVKGGA